MRFDACDRCSVLGQYILENRATVRETAARFGISKSTVHKDVTEHLKRSNPALFLSVKQVLGGEATRKKYLLLHELLREKGERKERTV